MHAGAFGEKKKKYYEISENGVYCGSNPCPTGVGCILAKHILVYAFLIFIQFFQHNTFNCLAKFCSLAMFEKWACVGSGEK